MGWLRGGAGCGAGWLRRGPVACAGVGWLVAGCMGLVAGWAGCGVGWLRAGLVAGWGWLQARAARSCGSVVA